MKNKSYNSPIDDKIINGFSLYKGLRPKKEDTKIHNTVTGLLFDETIRFLLDNLDHSQQTSLLSELDFNKRKPVEHAKLLGKYFKLIPNSDTLLQVRLDKFLNYLLIESLK